MMDMTNVASLDAVEAFAELVIHLAWAALITVSAIIVALSLRAFVSGLLRARFTRKP